jgi:hypothetical protein
MKRKSKAVAKRATSRPTIAGLLAEKALLAEQLTKARAEINNLRDHFAKEVQGLRHELASALRGQISHMDHIIQLNGQRKEASENVFEVLLRNKLIERSALKKFVANAKQLDNDFDSIDVEANYGLGDVAGTNRTPDARA